MDSGDIHRQNLDVISNQGCAALPVEHYQSPTYFVSRTNRIEKYYLSSIQYPVSSSSSNLELKTVKTQNTTVQYSTPLRSWTA
ncbi:hypothetical protein WAI453_003177 [Rhynchosporium graminicola]